MMEELDRVEFQEASVFDKPVSELSYGDFERFLTLVLNDGCVSFVTAPLPIQVIKNG